MSVGLSDIALHIPSPRVNVEDIISRRTAEDGRLGRHLARARSVTGQQAVRFPEVWEDPVTMAAEAARELLTAGTGIARDLIRYLVVGTESGVDHSKPVSAYVQGLLSRCGYGLNEAISSFQVQHACAAGTLALLSVAGLLNASPRREAGIVVSTDEARYRARTTAEITQGAGAVALMVEKDPALLELDLATVGFSSHDVDDFFRPLGSTTARVKGRYSMDCYKGALAEAVADHASRRELSSAEVLDQSDYVVLHAPFRNMPQVAMEGLLGDVLGLTPEQAAVYLDTRGLNEAVEAVARIGNIYSGSLYLSLASLLNSHYNAIGREIVGKRVLLASYGSGNTMAVISGRIADRAPEVVRRWSFQGRVAAYRDTDWEEYEQWTAGPYDGPYYESLYRPAALRKGSFYLSKIRDDGYREYSMAGVETPQPGARVREPAVAVI